MLSSQLYYVTEYFSLCFYRRSHRTVDFLSIQLRFSSRLVPHSQSCNSSASRQKGLSPSHLYMQLNFYPFSFLFRPGWFPFLGLATSASRQKGLSTSHLYMQLNPFALKLTTCKHFAQNSSLSYYFITLRPVPNFLFTLCQIPGLCGSFLSQKT